MFSCMAKCLGGLNSVLQERWSRIMACIPTDWFTTKHLNHTLRETNFDVPHPSTAENTKLYISVNRSASPF